MPTKKQHLTKVKKMLTSSNELVMQYAANYLNQGAVDLDKYGDDYQLPRILLNAAMLDAAYAYEPLTKEDKKVVKNLRNF